MAEFRGFSVVSCSLGLLMLLLSTSSGNPYLLAGMGKPSSVQVKPSVLAAVALLLYVVVVLLELADLFEKERLLGDEHGETAKAFLLTLVTILLTASIILLMVTAPPSWPRGSGNLDALTLGVTNVVVSACLAFATAGMIVFRKLRSHLELQALQVATVRRQPIGLRM